MKLHRTLTGALAVAIATSVLAGCQGPAHELAAEPTTSTATATTVPLRALLIRVPDGAARVMGLGSSSELRVEQTAQIINLADVDAIAEKLTELGYVTGVHQEWRHSGISMSVLLLQFADEQGAAGYVTYADEIAGGRGKTLTGIPEGLLYVGSSGATALFHKGTIAAQIRSHTDGAPEFDLDGFLTQVSRQYEKLAAA